MYIDHYVNEWKYYHMNESYIVPSMYPCGNTCYPSYMCVSIYWYMYFETNQYSVLLVILDVTRRVARV